MEVTNIYLDLKEWPKYATKNKTIWSLESEAFKDPLSLKIEYSDWDKTFFTDQIEALNSLIIHQDKQIETLNKLIIEYKSYIDDYNKALEDKNTEINRINKRYKDIIERLTAVDTAIENNQKDIEWIQLINNQIREKNNEIEQIIMRRPIVYEDEQFISWLLDYYFKPIELTWKYLIITKSNIIEKNEYVNNENDIVYEIKEIEWIYLPKYQLISTNKLNKPTAKIKLSVLFIPM